MHRIILHIFILFSINSKAQSESNKWKIKLNDCKISIGYLYQGEHLLESGVKIDLIQDKSKNFQNFSLISGAQLTNQNKITYVNPYIMLRYFKPIGSKNAFVVSLSGNYRKILDKISNSITPETGINLYHVATISYGYNVFLNEKYDWTLPHRLSLRLMLH